MIHNTAVTSLPFESVNISCLLVELHWEGSAINGATPFILLLILFILSTTLLQIFTYLWIFLYICKCVLFRMYILINLQYLNTYKTMKSNFHCCIEVKSFLSAPHLRAAVKRLTQYTALLDWNNILHNNNVDAIVYTVFLAHS